MRAVEAESSHAVSESVAVVAQLQLNLPHARRGSQLWGMVHALLLEPATALVRDSRLAMDGRKVMRRGRRLPSSISCGPAAGYMTPGQ